MKIYKMSRFGPKIKLLDFIGVKAKILINMYF